MSGLSEGELHVQAMRLVCEALADREQQGIEIQWDVLQQMLDQMDAILQGLDHKHRHDHCEIVDLRQQLAAELVKERDAARETILAQKRGNQYLRMLIDKVRGIVRCDEAMSERLEKISQALDDFDDGTTEPAPVAEPAPCPECERLRAVIDQAWQRIQQSISHADVAGLLAALAEIQSNSSVTITSSPTPVAEPAPCPECELSEEMQDAVPPTWAPVVWDLRRRLREAQQARGHELERLLAFVEQVRSVVNSEWYGIEMQTVRELLAQLDAGTTEPAPVAEPAPCPECERLQAELENANKHCADLVLFADKVRKCFRLWGSDDTFIHSVSHALSELDKSNPSATLTSSPTSVAERLDAEDGK